MNVPSIDRVNRYEQEPPVVERHVQLGAARRDLHQVEGALHLVPRACHLQHTSIYIATYNFAAILQLLDLH